MIGTVVAAAVISNMVTIKTNVKDGITIEYVTDETLRDLAGFKTVSGNYDIYDPDGDTLTGVRYAIGLRATVQPGDTFNGVRSYFEIIKAGTDGISNGDITVQYFEINDGKWYVLPMVDGGNILSGAFGPSAGVTLSEASNSHINQFLVTYNTPGDYTINFWSEGTPGSSN